MDYRLFDCDSHILEPPDLWTTWMAEAFRDRAPRVERDPNGAAGLCWVVEGRPPANAIAGGYLGATRDLGAYEDWLKTAGFEDTREGSYNPAARLKDMDEDGVAATILYPTSSTHQFSLTDAPYQVALFRAYNAWIADFCAHDPKRLGAVGLISVLDPDEAVREIRRSAKAGLRGVVLPVSLPEGMDYNDPVFDRVWAAAVESELPITFHHFTGPWYWPNTEGERDIRVLNICTDYQIKRTLVQMIFSGVFDRFPTLKIVIAEFEIAWLPYFLWMADHRYKLRPNFKLTGRYAGALPMLPSEYFQRQMWITLIEDPLVGELLGAVGEDRVMFSTDYPHVESPWPHSREYADRILASVDDAAKKKVIRENGAALYGFDLN